MTTPRTTARSLLFLLALFSLPACQPSAPPTDPMLALAGNWTLTDLGGNEISTLLPQGLKTPTLSITPDGAVTGNTGVNALSSALDPTATRRGEFHLPSILTTRMAGPPQAMVIESEYITSLREATNYTIKQDSLSLTKSSQPLLIFTRTK